MSRFIFCWFLISLLSPSSISAEDKINGINYVAERTHIDENGFSGIKRINAEWVSWIPYAYCDVNTGQISFNTPRQWNGETIRGTERAIHLAREKDLKVMLKPHVWLSDHSYTGDLSLNHSQWLIWQAGYKKYILAFAELAEKHNVAMFCIGTEQFSSIEHAPGFWRHLIEEVRDVYDGQLTYAANWDTYRECPFWNELDLIGVDAYFPLSPKKRPSVSHLLNQWEEWQDELASEANKYNKKVLFTEFGYRKAERATHQPWLHETDATYCETCQVKALKALFEVFWDEEWFAGGFLWKWYEQGKSITYQPRTSFYIQGTEAESVVEKMFRRYSSDQ